VHKECVPDKCHTVFRSNNLMKQTRLIKTRTGILLHNIELAHPAVLFKTSFYRRGLMNSTPPPPYSPVDIYIYM
jgi:hypothetical protein